MLVRIVRICTSLMALIGASPAFDLNLVKITSRVRLLRIVLVILTVALVQTWHNLLTLTIRIGEHYSLWMMARVLLIVHVLLLSY